LDKGETVDSIEDVMNEINELIDDHQEISEALSSGKTIIIIITIPFH